MLVQNKAKHDLFFLLSLNTTVYKGSVKTHTVLPLNNYDDRVHYDEKINYDGK